MIIKGITDYRETQEETRRNLLKPCPFCIPPFGAKRPDIIWDGGFYIACFNCGARGPFVETADEAIKQWNFHQDIATARAEALREAAGRALKFIESCNQADKAWAWVNLRAAILDDKQEEESPLAKRLVEVYNARLTGCDCSRCKVADKQEEKNG